MSDGFWKSFSRLDAMEIALMSIVFRHEKYGSGLPDLQITMAREALAFKPEIKKAGREQIDAAAVINEICERRGISRKKLCEAVNTKTSTLQRLMSGQTKSLNLTTYNKIIAWDNSQP